MAKAKETQETNQQANSQQGNRQQNESAPKSAGSSSQAMQTTGGQGEPQRGIARREQHAPSLWTGSPFAFMRRFTEEMDRLFEDFGAGRGLFGGGAGRELSPRGFGAMSQALWSPQTEIFERGGKLIVRADLPGLTKDDIDVNITDDAITIEGERRQESEENREGSYRSERSYGSFYRSIPLPEGVNAEDANATFRNGVLEITMPAPQRAEQRRRRLEIQEGIAGEESQQGRGTAAGQK